MKTLKLILIIFSSVLPLGLAAKLPPIQVNAILKNAAVITVNGHQQMITKNGSTKEGYKLVGIQSDSISLLINGKSYQIKPGATITSSKRPSRAREVAISRDSRGMFQVNGLINNYPVNFLVDTGATYVALNSDLAKQIGIDYLSRGEPTLGNTASGIVKTYKLKLNNIKIGEIQLYHVDAVVIEGSFPITTLLGMSFLQRVQMKDEGQFLSLVQK